MHFPLHHIAVILHVITQRQFHQCNSCENHNCNFSSFIFLETFSSTPGFFLFSSSNFFLFLSACRLFIMSAHDTQLAPVSMNPNRVMTSFRKLSSLHNSLILSGNSNQQVRFLLAQTLIVRTCVILIMDVNRVFSVLWIFAHDDKISMASSGTAHPINKEIKIPNAFCSSSWSLFTSHPCLNVTSAPRWQSASMCGANPPIVRQPVMEALSFTLE